MNRILQYYEPRQPQRKLVVMPLRMRPRSERHRRYQRFINARIGRCSVSALLLGIAIGMFVTCVLVELTKG